VSDDDNIMPIPESLLYEVWNRRIRLERKSLVMKVLITTVHAVAAAMALYLSIWDWQQDQALTSVLWGALAFINCVGMSAYSKEWLEAMRSIDAVHSSREAFDAGKEPEKTTYRIEVTRTMIDLAAAAANWHMAEERRDARED
jgi:hypothetical protein